MEIAAVFFNNVLLVDDSRSARFALRKLLERQGMQVEVAEDATKALEFLSNNHPDVIFMDHFMPGMNGFEVSKIIRNNPETANIPIIMCTSSEGDEYFKEAQLNGANAILTKPVIATALLEVLESIKSIQIHPESSPNQTEITAEAEVALPCERSPIVVSGEAFEKQLTIALDAMLPQLRQSVMTELDVIIKPLLKTHVEQSIAEMQHNIDDTIKLRCSDLIESTSEKLLTSIITEKTAKMQDQIESEFSEQISEIYSGLGELRAKQSLKKVDEQLLAELTKHAAQVTRDEAIVVFADANKLAKQSAKHEANIIIQAETQILTAQLNTKLVKASEVSIQKAKQEAIQVSWDKMQQVDELLKKKFGKLFVISGVALVGAIGAISGLAYLLLS